mgnify:CR=1 FL=1
MENRGQEGGEATAVQEQIILPLRAQNYATLVPGKKSERTVFTMAKFTIPDDKCLVWNSTRRTEVVTSLS